MRYRLREVEDKSKFSQELSLEAINRAVPKETIKAVLAAEGVGAVRERKLNMVVTVMLVIVMNLYTTMSLGQVMKKLGRGLRYICVLGRLRVDK